MNTLRPRKRLAQLVTALGLAALLIPFAACQRSASFKQDQDYYKSDVASSDSYYASRSSKGNVTQRVESLGQPKKRVAVFNFWNDTPVKIADIGFFASDELKRNLYLTQRLIIPSDLRKDLNTDDFIQGDKVKVAQLIREGRKVGVAVLIIGRISKIAFRQRGDDIGLLRQKQSLAAVDVEIKIFDVAAGREIMAAARSGETSSSAMVALEGNNMESPEYRAEMTKFAVRNAVGLLVPDVLKSIEKMTWEGRIAKIAGNRVYVNAGRQSGLIAGDILKVLTPGDDVYDPASGAFLGRAQGQLKGTLEVTDFIGTDGAVTETHTGGNFQEGDVVQLY